MNTIQIVAAGFLGFFFSHTVAANGVLRPVYLALGGQDLLAFAAVVGVIGAGLAVAAVRAI